MPGKKIMAMFALAALLLAVPLALAQVPPEAPEAPVIEPLAQPAEQAEEQIEGEVSAVENNTVTVSTADGEEGGAAQQQDENETPVEEPASPEEEVSAPVSEQPEDEAAETEMDLSAESGEAAEGKVTGVNTNNNILVIQTPEGEYLAFRLTDDTAVVSDAGQEAGIEDLSFGVDVSVEYDAQTKNLLEITVLSAPEENVSAPAQEENVSLEP
ncbi:MAG: hypothetical protein SVE93_05005 [Candidatus Thermoplasmatota archaeon]|nr:hypothetical protein [Candidatus Thermoplasmatota archaeon]